MSSPTIVTFANEAYIPVAHNWLSAVKKAAVPAAIKIIAMDAVTRDAFPDDIILYRPQNTEDLADLWRFRIQVLRELLSTGPWLIHSDADAVWLRDPLPMIQSCGTEMVFSQGTVWPPDVHTRHGIVVCCGFFHLRNTAPVQSFMAKLEDRVHVDRDDQISVNRLLDESGLEWVVEDPYRIPFRHTNFVASRRIIRSNGSVPASVAVLPHHLFPRVMDGPDPEVVVAHPFSPKNCADKIEVLRRLGLWR